jgi:hypothetical protein
LLIGHGRNQKTEIALSLNTDACEDGAGFSIELSSGKNDLEGRLVDVSTMNSVSSSIVDAPVVDLEVAIATVVIRRG